MKDILKESYWYYVRPDAIRALHNETFRKTLSWYYAILLDDYPAKFHIAKAVEIPRDVGNMNSLDIDSLVGVHRDTGKIFTSLWQEVRKSGIGFREFKKKYGESTPNLLDLETKIAFKILKSCRFCEWRCGIDRSEGRRGFCRLDSRSYVHSWFLHIGEEAPLVPSGTIFYGSCNFRCVFCQNWDISQENPFNGIEVSSHQLALMQKDLRRKGARNINHVGGDPTPDIHNILDSMRFLDVNVPQLWNSNFYMSEEALNLLIYVIDIWLPDFKYGNNSCAQRLSGIPKYLEVVGRNHRIAIEWGDMIIRHLVLPNHIECCLKPVLRWIAENLPKDRVLVNIMDQYRPEYKAHQYSDINRHVSSKELEEVYEYADQLELLWRDIS
ncbi:MAG: pyruvate formate lyase-activating protein [Ignisphaera sp.]|uniref:Pyruvate formate lyase-activating protein n=1 Tax=Ignisphaera aggregans TaxID=334771 RepID=A0A7J3MX25_9CREN